MVTPQLDDLILQTVASLQEAGEEIYGASVRNKIIKEINLQLPITQVNETLYRLAHFGFLTYTVGKTKVRIQGPKRKIYTLSYAGIIKLKALKEVQQNLWHVSSMKIS